MKNNSSSPFALEEKEKKKKLCLIRHAQSYFNMSIENDQEYYERDPDITSKGMEQCIELNKRLEKFHFDLLLISPLKRTISTFENSNLNCDRRSLPST